MSAHRVEPHSRPHAKRESRRFLALLAGIALVLLGLSRWSETRPPRAEDSKAGAPKAVAGYLFNGRLPEAGTRLSYDFMWISEQHNQLLPYEVGKGSGEPISGRVEVRGTVELEMLSSSSGDGLLELRFRRVDPVTWSVLGRDLAKEGDALKQKTLGATALVVLDAEGGVRELRFAADAPGPFRSLAQNVLTHALFERPTSRMRGATGMSTFERTTIGAADADYFVDSQNQLRRSRSRYTELDGVSHVDVGTLGQELSSSSRWEFQPGGMFYVLVSQESLRFTQEDGAVGYASDSEVRMVLLDRTRGAVRTDATSLLRSTEPRQVWGVTVDEATRKQTLEKRVGDLRPEQIKGAIALYGYAGQRPERGLVFRIAGYLELHPEYVHELVRIATVDGAPAKQRSFVMDLLLSAGTDAAQTGMRSILNHPSVRATPEHAKLVNRLALLRKPTRETAMFARAEYDRTTAAMRAGGEDAGTYETDRGARRAAAYALGAIAGRLIRQGDADLGKDHNAHLARALGEASTEEDVQTLVLALGNAHLTENVPAIVARASSSDAVTRAAVADALGGTDSPAAHAALLALASDAEEAVVERAFTNLQDHTVSDEDALLLAELVTAGKVPPGAYVAVAAFLNRKQLRGEAIAKAIRHMHDRTTDEQLKGRLRGMHRAQLSPSPSSTQAP